MGILSLGKTILTKNPSFAEYASPIYNGTIGFNSKRIRGHNNRLLGCSFLKHSSIVINGNNNCIDLGNISYLDNCKFFIQGNNNYILLGKKNFLKNAEFWIEDDENYIEVGNHTSIQGSTHLAAIEGSKIIIGYDCMFSSDVVIRTGDSHSIIGKDTNNRINRSEDVTVGNHVWIGNQTIILKGSSIPDNSIVGTGAIVTRKFDQSHVVLAGNPAKIIKENTDWLRERIKMD